MKTLWQKLKNYILAIFGIGVAMAAFYGGDQGTGDVECNQTGLTQVRFERKTKDGIFYKDAFNFTPSECEAYNELPLGQKIQKQKNRADAWVTFIRNQDGNIQDIATEVDDE